MAFTVGAVISAIFGMNLKSHVRKAEGWFFWVVLGIIGIMIIVIVVSYVIYWFSKWAATAQASLNENNIFCQSVSDDAYILSLGCNFSAETEALPKAVLD